MRDAGVLYITHFTLLLGLAIPAWLSPLNSAGDDGSAPIAARHKLEHFNKVEKFDNYLMPLSGVMIIGVGDAIASVVGVLWGRIHLHKGSLKTLEGTAAGIFAAMCGWWGLFYAQGWLNSLSRMQWATLLVTTIAAGLLEALTHQLDNLLVPLHYFAHICLVLQRP